MGPSAIPRDLSCTQAGYAGGSTDGDWGDNGLASGSVPRASNFGSRADGLYTDVSGRDLYGSAAHLFWRDSDRGLPGLVGRGAHEGDISAFRGGVERELR